MDPMTPQTPVIRDPNATAACSNCGRTHDPQLAGSALCRDCAEGTDLGPALDPIMPWAV